MAPPGSSEVAVSPDTVVHLRRAKDLMDRCFGEPLDLDALAAEAGFSRFHFARTFRAAYGETPRTYLTRRRIERAKQLLANANLTVTEVCVLVGFASLGSFSARFTELVGRSPSAYRDEQVARGGPPAVPGCFVLAWARPVVPSPVVPSPVVASQSASEEKPPTPPGRSVRPPTGTGDDDDHEAVPRQRLGPRPGRGEGVLHREARLRGPQRPPDG